MKHSVHYDLHCHSTASDGSLSPSELVGAAYRAGVRVLALTDHDTVGGLAEAGAAAQRHEDMLFIPGIELTCLWESRVVHLLGLGIDPTADALLAYINQLTELRQQRAEKIAAKLVKRGLPDLLPVAIAIAAGGQLGRPHFAQALVEAGFAGDKQQAFDLYLGQGKAGDVKTSWPTLEQAVAVVQEAGGQAVIAHPTKYNFTFTRIRALAARLGALGGCGLEVSYPGVTPNHVRDLIRLADQLGMHVSAGSDFHSPEQRWTGLGRFLSFQAPRHVLELLVPEWVA